jgi:magnesium chelatase family protein
MNPCPCGHLGDRVKRCRCSAAQVHQYRAKISGPLLDRIDIHLEVPALKTDELMNGPAGTPSSAIRGRVVAARELQLARLRSENIFANAQMSARQLRKYCHLGKTELRLLREAVETLGLSARAHDKVLKLARTIADLDGKDDINSTHLAEAIGYRTLDRINA